MSSLILGICIFTILIPDLSSSLLHCPSKCVCDDDTLDVNCEEGHLDVLPIALNPSIQRLVIKNNKIRTIASSMYFYSDLTLLDLSFNYLFNIPDNTFSHQRRLQQLHLNHNKISLLTNKTFIGLAELSVLNLRGNLIIQIDTMTFQPLSKLEELNLGQNRITDIDADAFSGLSNLKVLYLDDNMLHRIPSKAFYPINKLAELYIGTNTLLNIEDSAFSPLNELNLLDLRCTLLSNISRTLFTGIENIKILNLSDNRFNKLPTEELSALRRLEELAIGQNYFENLPANSLIGMSNLRVFELKGSLYLRKIDSEAFKSNNNLEKIAIESNKALESLEEGTFAGLLYLRHLSLRNNGIRRINPNLLSWNHLKSLDISENPLSCDCDYSRLHQNLLKVQNLNYNYTMCTHLPEDWECKYLLAENPSLISLLVLSAAILTAILLTFYKFRAYLREFFQRGCKSKSESTESIDYHKTITDEDYIVRQSSLYSNSLAAAPPPLLNNYPQYMNQNIYYYTKPLPITEL